MEPHDNPVQLFVSSQKPAFRLIFTFSSRYIQNAGVKNVVDGSGKMRTKNNQKPLPAKNQPIPYDNPTIPIEPAGGLPPINSLEPAMQRLIKSAQALFEERPIWTRRALRNCISADDYKETGSNAAKYLYQYVGYIFESGPWRDAVLKFGVDPRKDPNLRIYQTMMFILDKEYNDSRRRKAKEMDKGRNKRPCSNSRETHIFDGTAVNLDGKVWQVCDITDPLLESLLSTTKIREKCHVSSLGPVSDQQVLTTHLISRFEEMVGTIAVHGPKQKA